MFPGSSRPFQFNTEVKARMFFLAVKGDTFTLRDGSRRVADNPILVKRTSIDDDWEVVLDE